MRRIIGFVLAAAACSEGAKAPERDWGRTLQAEAVEDQAEETLSARDLPDRPARILGMSFAEARARLGPIRFDGQAELSLARNEHELEVVEKTVIASGPGTDVRVVQRDGDDYVTREGIRQAGQWFIRSGEGRLRKADFIHNARVTMVNEAFSALGLVARLLGEAARFSERGAETVSGLPARRFDVEAAPKGSVRVGDHELRPVRADGRLWISEAGVPVRYELALTFRTAPAGGEEDGRLELNLEGRLRTIAPEGFDVEAAVEPLRALEADLNPLGFLEDLTRTSTVIGGD